MLKNYIVPSVVVLFFHCRPATVVFPITLVVVNAVKGRSGRAFPHVGKKILKLFPSGIVTYPPPPISGIGMVFGVFTSCLHVCPYSVSGGDSFGGVSVREH